MTIIDNVSSNIKSGNDPIMDSNSDPVTDSSNDHHSNTDSTTTTTTTSSSSSTTTTAHKMLLTDLSQKNSSYKKISKEQLLELEELFLMDGITPNQAGKIVGVRFETAKSYFEKWAEDLVDDEHYETWVDRQKRIRARALEGITKDILATTERLRHLEVVFANIILTKNEKGALITKNVTEINHKLQYTYETQIRHNVELLAELKAQAFVISSAVPVNIILDRELSKAIAEKQIQS